MRPTDCNMNFNQPHFYVKDVPVYQARASRANNATALFTSSCCQKKLIQKYLYNHEFPRVYCREVLVVIMVKLSKHNFLVLLDFSVNVAQNGDDNELYDNHFIFKMKLFTLNPQVAVGNSSSKDRLNLILASSVHIKTQFTNFTFFFSIHKTESVFRSHLLLQNGNCFVCNDGNQNHNMYTSMITIKLLESWLKIIFQIV